jgi:hypothetical protein
LIAVNWIGKSRVPAGNSAIFCNRKPLRCIDQILARPDFCQNIEMEIRLAFVSKFLLLTLLSGCDQHVEQAARAGILQTGTIENPKIDEASGLQASQLNPGAYFVHNDDGPAVIYAMSESGVSLGKFSIEKANNRDWEDMTIASSEEGPLLVIADFGDNAARFKSVHIYFVHEPRPNINNQYSGSYPIYHRIKIKYPDGPRDCEAIAYDRLSDKLYLVSKRDKPSRIYSIPLKDALSADEATLQYEGQTASFRAPTARDAANFGTRQSQWISQATGLDFSPDGKQAAVITYRSLYLFDREADESWASALSRNPRELIGPPARAEESIAYSVDGSAIIVTSEGVPAPVYRIRLMPGDS